MLTRVRSLVRKDICRSLSHEIGKEVHNMPSWLLMEMKTNHAGEYGAVQIYTGAYYGLRVHEQINIWIDGRTNTHTPFMLQLTIVSSHPRH